MKGILFFNDRYTRGAGTFTVEIEHTKGVGPRDGPSSNEALKSTSRIRHREEIFCM